MEPKAELPRLSDDVEGFLQKKKDEIDLLGDPRAMLLECCTYLSQHSIACYDICKADIRGIYKNTSSGLDKKLFSLKPEAFTRCLLGVF